FTSSKHERGQPAPTGADKARKDEVGIIFLLRRLLDRLLWRLLSGALVVPLRGSGLTSGALLTKERRHIADAPYNKSTVLLLDLELFLVCSSGFGSRCADAVSGFHARRIHAICHVISRQACAGRSRGYVSLAIDQCGNGLGMSLFYRPHQCSCAAN